MLTTLYASVWADGRVVRADADHEIPPEVLADFLGQVHEFGNVIIGRRTAELMAGAGAGALGSADLVVLSSSTLHSGAAAASPGAALADLATRGHARALVGGGGTTYDSFLGQPWPTS